MVRWLAPHRVEHVPAHGLILDADDALISPGAVHDDVPGQRNAKGPGATHGQEPVEGLEGRAGGDEPAVPRVGFRVHTLPRWLVDDQLGLASSIPILDQAGTLQHMRKEGFAELAVAVGMPTPDRRAALWVYPGIAPARDILANVPDTDDIRARHRNRPRTHNNKCTDTLSAFVSGMPVPGRDSCEFGMYLAAYRAATETPARPNSIAKRRALRDAADQWYHLRARLAVDPLEDERIIAHDLGRRDLALCVRRLNSSVHVRDQPGRRCDVCRYSGHPAWAKSRVLRDSMTCTRCEFHACMLCVEERDEVYRCHCYGCNNHVCNDILFVLGCVYCDDTIICNECRDHCDFCDEPVCRRCKTEHQKECRVECNFCGVLVSTDDALDCEGGHRDDCHLCRGCARRCSCGQSSLCPDCCHRCELCDEYVCDGCQTEHMSEVHPDNE